MIRRSSSLGHAGYLIRTCLSAVALVAAGMPADALEPDQREVVVIHGRVWEGYEYKEMFLPSTSGTMTLMAGAESAIAYVRTLEYYWPLSRQVYVDFERKRETMDGELVIRRGGEEVARERLQPHAVLYPEGAVNGNGRLLWGEEAERAYAEHRDSERLFTQEYAAAMRAHSQYEQRLLASGTARNRGEATRPIGPPPPLPRPSLRLVTKPALGFRVELKPGNYTIALEKDGQIVPSTGRRLYVAEAVETTDLVADVVPPERWTRPLATNIQAARIFVRPGTVFYMTVAEASHFSEDDYLPVVSPQAEPVAGRSMWVRRRPATVDRLEVSWEGDETDLLTRQPLKVEQTRGSAYGYRIRAARDGEEADLDAFVIDVPEGRAGTRGTIAATGQTSAPFLREIVVVHSRRSMLAFALALLPLAGYLVLAGYGKLVGPRER